jgi:hypothetical protein
LTDLTVGIEAVAVALGSARVGVSIETTLAPLQRHLAAAASSYQRGAWDTFF